MEQTRSDHTSAQGQPGLDFEQLPVKNTFIDFPAEDEDNDGGPRTPPMFSAPGAMLTHLFATVQKASPERSATSTELPVPGGTVVDGEQLYQRAPFAGAPSVEEVPEVDATPADSDTTVAMAADAVAADAEGADVAEVVGQLGSLTITEAPLETAAVTAQPPTEVEWSIGSALHELGKCKPCAHRWKPGGCPRGIQCTKCHLCPHGEIEARKKNRDTSDPKCVQEPQKPLVEPAYVQPVSLGTGFGSSAVRTPPTLLSKPLPQKNTFIHFEDSTGVVEREDDDKGGPQELSSNPPLFTAPGLMLSAPFMTKYMPSKSAVPALTEATSSAAQPEDPGSDRGLAVSPAGSLAKATVRELHDRKECKPCAYFYFKADGCRSAEICEFCHLCDKGEIKRRKRQRVKELKAGSVAVR